MDIGAIGRWFVDNVIIRDSYEFVNGFEERISKKRERSLDLPVENEIRMGLLRSSAPGERRVYPEPLPFDGEGPPAFFGDKP